MKFSNQPVIPANPAGRVIPANVAGFQPFSEQADIENPARKLGYAFALAVVFVRYSLLHEVLSYYSNFNFRILYLVSIPAALCLFGSGSFVQRAFSPRAAKYWLAFVVWLFICVPFSTWRGDSATYALTYLRTDLPILMFLAALPMTWKETRGILYTIAISGLVSVSFSRFFGTTYAGRTGLAFGTMANPNDYAGQLIMVLPIVLFMVLRPMRIFPPLRFLLQAAGVLAISYGSYLILASGSRGALLSILACLVFAFVKARTPVRLGLLVAVPLAAAALIAVLPSSTLERLHSFSTVAKNVEDGTAESAYMRKKLLMASLYDTMTHPLFGLGPGQFENFEGRTKTHNEGGFTGSHNSYTQISSETGIPGFLFYIGGTLSAFFLLQRTWKSVAKLPQAKEISLACFLVSISLLGFCVAIFFLNFGYYFYLPGYTGLIICLSASVKREVALITSPAAEPQAPLFTAFTGRRPEPAWAVGKVQPVIPPNRFYPGTHR